MLYDKEYTTSECYENCLEYASCAGFLFNEGETDCILVEEGCVYDESLSHTYYAMSNCTRGKNDMNFFNVL